MLCLCVCKLCMACECMCMCIYEYVPVRACAPVYVQSVYVFLPTCTCFWLFACVNMGLPLSVSMFENEWNVYIF